jgi:hypothetical protein
VGSAGGAGGAGDGNSAGSAGDPGQTAGAGGEGGSKSGCTEDPNLLDIECQGGARAKVRPGSVELLFDDGSSLQSTSELGRAAFVDGERVWVSYTDKFEIDCPFCGGRTRQRIEVRASASGPLLTFGLSGQVAQPIPSSVLEEVFGAPLVSTPLCHQDLGADCIKVSRTQLDYTLGTIPQQRLPHGQVTSITNARGERLRVLLAQSSDISTRDPNCSDGRSPIDDSSFVATRLP